MAKKKLLIAAVIVGMFAAFLLYLYTAQIEEEKDELLANPRDVVVAARDIQAGTLLSRELVNTKSVPGQFLPANPLLSQDLDIYLDMPVSESIKEGSMILTSDFAVAEVARTLSARIPAGERAMTIPVDAISGVSGLLRPGDRVDILGTFPVGNEDNLIPEASGQESIGYVTMNLLQNVTLLAVGQEISDIPSGDSRGNRGQYSTVTLSLTPSEAELLVISQTRGKLMLLLRHRDDIEAVTVTKTTLREVLEELEVINRKRQVRVQKRPKCAAGQKLTNGRCEDTIEFLR
ncbi:Flp pilus assembly protein CpaB [Lujinxingia litoralis]|uniref:Flp pilus assembly protein CpaB n=1 Tax=Lujinxingia litoralis TaxID=2211119 RepID=A0A328C890_9DELT|nr:Flp pilus assembly protein CpaB [Lujinxingia litoralis]RAL24817.1 Flp pilus assembly protein CpaB [Lujinxingia litoralis]